MTAANGSSVVGKSKRHNCNGPTCSADGPTFYRPPRHELENRGEIGIDCIAFPMSLAFVPSVSYSQQILPQRLRGVRNVVLKRFSQAGRRQPKIRRHSFEICHCFKSESD